MCVGAAELSNARARARTVSHRHTLEERGFFHSLPAGGSAVISATARGKAASGRCYSATRGAERRGTMHTILLALSTDRAFEVGLGELLHEAGADVRILSARPSDASQTDLLVSTAEDLRSVSPHVRHAVSSLLLITESTDPVAMRAAVRASALVPLIVDHGHEKVALLPAEAVRALVLRSADLPRPLRRTEAEFLGLVTTMSVEGAGSVLGFSRRQVQRRFRTLCTSLGLSDHREAVVAAAQWGLRPEAHQESVSTDCDK